MQKHTLLFTIILNLLSTAVWGEDFLVNYYHKGVVLHTQRVAQGSAIGALPELNLVSCNDEIPLFAGWIAESDANNYQTISATTPTLVTADYVPTADINLYAIFADKEASNEMTWQQVKSKSELKDNDQIIIAAHNHDYAIGKTIDKKERLTSVGITKSNDKSTLIANDNVQIFTLEKISDILWGIHGEDGYLCNTSDENSIGTIAEIKNWSSWGITFDATTYSVKFTNNYMSWPPYLYFNDISSYFACRKSSISNLAIYKQSQVIVNYIACTTPDAVEYTITLHDGGNTSEIKCMSDASITQPVATQAIGHWQFYGWATSSIEKTTNTPEIITFPYTPKGNIDLYAVYYATTADSLILQDKTMPEGWKVNESREDDKSILLREKGNHITIPYITDIIGIEVDMFQKSSYNQNLLISNDRKDITFFAQSASSSHVVYRFDFDEPTSTSLHFYTHLEGTNNRGVFINQIIIHRKPIYALKGDVEQRYVVSFNPNSESEEAKQVSISQSKGGCVRLPKNTFTNDLDFLCWNTISDGSGIDYADESTIDNITEDITLYAQWGEIVEIAANESLVVNADRTIDRLVVKKNSDYAVGQITIADDAELSVSKNIILDFEIDSSRYHFFSLPFDCDLMTVEAIDCVGKTLTYAPNSIDGDWVICRYDQTLAANNAGEENKHAWVEILDKEYVLKANQGYIIGYFGEEKSAIVKFISNDAQSISTPQTKVFDLGEDYCWYSDGENMSSNGWNLIGSPYYETLTQGALTQFVTIPNPDGKTYTQCLYQEALLERLITPFSAFFVQLKDNVAPQIIPEELDWVFFDEERLSKFMQIELSDGMFTDKTSIWNLDSHTPEYEIGSDLKKWIGYGNRPQIYTIQNNIPLAYNSQKIDNTTVLLLGVYAPTEGEYTFSVNENCPDLYLIDKQKNITTNLAQSDYTVLLSEGIDNNRFEIIFQKMTATHLTNDTPKLKYFVQNGSVFVQNIPENGELYLYDCTGKLVDITNSSQYKLPFRGVYHIIIIKNNVIIDNFDIIY